MRIRLFLAILLAAAAAAALGGALVAAAGAEQSGELPELSAPELLTRMGDPTGAPDAISGDIVWTNELFGELPFVPDHVAEPAESPLMASGSGRIWAQDGKVRLESQAQGGDQVVVADSAAGTVWTYTFATDTAHLYEWGGIVAHSGDEADGPRPSSAPPDALAPERVSALLRAAARVMTVEVIGQDFVAGRDAYVLALTPTADDTALGRIEASIDGRTFVPLRVDVLARGHDDPTLSFGFTRVSYDPVDAAVFTFTPPEGATVQRDVIDPSGEALDRDETEGSASSGEESAATAEQMKELARTALLTRAEAAELVDFPLAWARDYTSRDFRWAYAFDEGAPVNALGSPVFDMAKLFGGPGASSGDDPAVDGEGADVPPPAMGPSVVLLYGEGFGSIILAETKTTAGIREQMEQLPEVVGSIDVSGAKAQAVVTPLGSVVMWERDGVTLVAAGMVPRADIIEFVASVR